MKDIVEASKTFLSSTLVHNPEQVPSLTCSYICSGGRIINCKCADVFSNTEDG